LFFLFNLSEFIYLNCIQQCEELKIGAVPAPFGKGLNSVVNSSLSKAWQIHAAKVSVSSNGNNDFNSRTIPALTNLALNRLGLLNDAVPVEAHLFQVLLYEPGGQFVKHRNLQRTLVIFV